jgi:beta-1,4-mannooligosaccharide/beta-1,4-mannosyl-N-acetylglucosamine phosphorylase
MQRTITRHPDNPILTTADVPYPCTRCFNPAATKFGDQYLLLARTQDADGVESLGLALSDDGVHFTIQPEPVLTPEGRDNGRLNDPRITKIDDTYYICYCTDARDGIKIGIMSTRDFKTFDRLYYSEPDNRNAVLFPEKINGLYARLDRPFTHWYWLDRAYDIWISYSPDLRYWGDHRMVLSYEDVPWGNNKIGPGPQPIKTDEGWLVIYHGAEHPDGTDTDWQKTYRAGVMLLDLDDPSKVIAQPMAPLMSPETDYETDPARRPNVIFLTGAIVEDDGEIKLYYGAADLTIATATTSIDKLLDFCLNPPEYQHPIPPPPDPKPPRSQHA